MLNQERKKTIWSPGSWRIKALTENLGKLNMPELAKLCKVKESILRSKIIREGGSTRKIKL